MSDTLKTIFEKKIIAIVRGFTPEIIVKLAEAYTRNGIRCMELTFDQSDESKRQQTAATIKFVKDRLGDEICIGAGTVMTAEQVSLAAQAGAEYMISPNVDDEVIRETKRLCKISIPGAMTPSEIAYAYKMGADLVKLFPANEVGLGYIKAIKAPLKHIPLLATGGVRPGTAADYLKAGCSALGVGGDLVNRQWIENGEYDKIGAAAKAFVDSVNFEM